MGLHMAEPSHTHQRQKGPVMQEFDFGFPATIPNPQARPKPTWDALTPDEQAAFDAGREHQAPISLREGARMGRITWLCWGVVLACAVIGPMKCSGLVP